MMNCREVTQVLSEDRKLNWRKRVELRLHLLMCHSCNAFARQLAILKKSMSALITGKGSLLGDEGSDQLENMILQKLEKMKNEGGLPPDKTDD